MVSIRTRPSKEMMKAVARVRARERERRLLAPLIAGFLEQGFGGEVPGQGLSALLALSGNGSAAYRGLAGDVVRTILPDTESDPAALLLTFLTMFGSAVGPGPHAIADGSEHPARLFTLVVGETANARKGTSYANVHRIMKRADTRWAVENTARGLSSGEGFLELLAQSPGHTAMVKEEEFSSILGRAQREGNTLSEQLRSAWDNGDLRLVTRKNPLAVQGAHASIVGHITADELRKRLTETAIANGFANRFLYCYATRRKLLPSGGSPVEEEVGWIADVVARRLAEARGVGLMERTPEAEELWEDVYRALAASDDSGPLGSLTARAAAQCLRLSVVYALLDGAAVIGPEHVRAAASVWAYSHLSVLKIFDEQEEALEDQVQTLIDNSGEKGLSQSDLNRAFKNRERAADLRRAIASLENRGFISVKSVRTPGRSKTVYCSKEAVRQ